jgi:hypothetical protein
MFVGHPCIEDTESCLLVYDYHEDKHSQVLVAVGMLPQLRGASMLHQVTLALLHWS